MYIISFIKFNLLVTITIACVIITMFSFQFLNRCYNFWIKIQFLIKFITLHHLVIKVFIIFNLIIFIIKFLSCFIFSLYRCCLEIISKKIQIHIIYIFIIYNILIFIYLKTVCIIILNICIWWFFIRLIFF